ncbi:MAG: tRNA (N(6)-L-threonylcarbamoyladenosine(37)-C(2))-methylthiotransferase MtaB [Dehalococcoidia bacterium]
MSERLTVAVLNQGCKLNQADGEAIARRLAGEGVRVVSRPEKGADGFVINTCSVTHVADAKARQLTRLARRLSPAATIVLTGCYAETAPANVAELTGADFVLGNAGKPEIPSPLVERLRLRGDPAAGCPDPAQGALRTRAFVKIQEGCDEMCAFCIVPRTRGRERSVPIEKVLGEVRAREAEGVLEVVLTGTQLGNYGRDLGWTEQGPRRLLEALLEGTDVPRIHLSSLQAQDIRPELVRLWRDARLNPHFHLPLQSGSDGVLRRMRRRYTADRFREAVLLVRSSVPDVSITTDVIAGFPGETDADFEATAALCREMGFAAVHAFPYSRRAGTGANLMPDQAPVAVRRQRLERLLAIGETSARAFRERYMGRVMPVLWEEERRGRWSGLTPNYLRVFTNSERNLANSLLPARLIGLTAGGLEGELGPAGVRAA